MTLTPESSPILTQPDFALAYDSAGNVGTITHGIAGGSSLATFAYAYDAANRLTHETNAEGSVTYTYDNTNQLTSATGARSESYAHDANGNRNTTGYTVGTGGTLSASPNATYTYDSAGHMTAKTDTATGKVTTFSYDYRDRMTGATRKTSGSVVDYQVTYTYDALNRRIGEQIDTDGAGSGAPVQTWTLFDGQNPYADFTGSGTLKDRYLYGPAVDALLARTDASGTTAWYLADRLGSVRDIVDTSGTVLYHTGYDSFGNNISTSGSGGDRFGFTGREHDAALNLYYNRARFYDPATGRFLSKDPIGFKAGDSNFYRYVGNSPTNGTDPTGLDGLVLPWSRIIAIGMIDGPEPGPVDAVLIGLGLTIEAGIGLSNLYDYYWNEAGSGSGASNSSSGSSPTGPIDIVGPPPFTAPPLLPPKPNLPKPPANPIPLKNPPQLPPYPLINGGSTGIPYPNGVEYPLPGGESIRVNGPTSVFPDGYWRWWRPESPGSNRGGWVDPGTNKAGGNAGQTHIPLPPGFWHIVP